MKLNEYQHRSKRTFPQFDEVESRVSAFTNYGLGLSGESGEVVDHIKKHVFHGHDLNVDHIEKELGDVLHYVAGIAEICGLSLEDVARTNLIKLKKRYPNGFSEEDSRNRIERSNNNDSRVFYSYEKTTNYNASAKTSISRKR